MRFLIYFLIVLLYSSCHILRKNQSKLSFSENNIILYANATTGEGFSNKLNLKTKIILLEDSLLVEIYPFMGLKLGEVVINDDRIFINQSIANIQESIYHSTVDPKFETNYLINSIFQNQLKNDSVFYSNQYIGSVFTDYGYLDFIYLPSKVIYWDKKDNIKKTVYLDFKSIKYSYRE